MQCQSNPKEDYLDNRIFSRLAGDAVEPDPDEVKGFEVFIERYKAALAVEKAAIEAARW